MATIATHNGHTLSQGHNRRDPKYTSKDGHIKPNGHYEIWLDKDIKEMYHELFDGAVQTYNQEQKRDDRKIKDYYQKIKADQKKHLAYETIIGVYKTDKKVSEATKKEILKEYCDTWEARNPNLKLLGVYYHADEPGEPHVHIDYIPVASHSRGMQLQNGMRRALEEQGCIGKSRGTNPVKLWTQKENKFLEDLCNERGIKVEHDTEKRKHLSVKGYKEVNDYIRDEKEKFDKSVRNGIPEKKGILFKRYSKEDLEDLENKFIAIKQIEEKTKRCITDIPDYIKKQDEEITKGWKAQNEVEQLCSKLDEANEKYMDSHNLNMELNRKILELQKKLDSKKKKKEVPGPLKEEKEERGKSLVRAHDDFDLEK